MFLFVSIAFIYEWNWRAVLWMTYVRLKASTLDRTLSNGLHSQCLKYAQYTADRAVDVVHIFVYATKVTFNKPVDIHSYSKSIFIHAMAYNFFYSSRTLSSIHFFTWYCKTFWTHWGCEKPISNVLVYYTRRSIVRSSVFHFSTLSIANERELRKEQLWSAKCESGRNLRIYCQLIMSSGFRRS